MVNLNAAGPALPSTRKRSGGSAFIAPASNEYRTTCKVCHLGIYGGDETVWGRGRYIGLIHAPCAVQAGVTVVAQQPQPAQRPAAAVSSAEPRSYGDTLTGRQLTMLQALAGGLTITQIAQREQVTKQTVDNTLRNARHRVDAANNAELLAIARRRGLIRGGRP